MKPQFLWLLFLLVVPNCATNREFHEMRTNRTVCYTWFEHDLCVCHGTSGNRAWAFVAPDRVCQKEMSEK